MTNKNVLIPIFVQHDNVNLGFLELVMFDLSLKYRRLTTFGCKDIGIIKLKFVTKTQFLSLIMKLPKVLMIMTIDDGIYLNITP